MIDSTFNNYSKNLVLFIIGFILGVLFTSSLVYENNYPVHVSLPEEYQLIDSTDVLRGYYKKDTLVIEFDN